jgi:hypothetical protein
MYIKSQIYLLTVHYYYYYVLGFFNINFLSLIPSLFSHSPHVHTYISYIFSHTGISFNISAVKTQERERERERERETETETEKGKEGEWKGGGDHDI